MESKNYKSKIFNNPLFWPIVIFFLASIFRIFFMDIIEFKADEAYAVYLINNFFLNPQIIPYSSFSNTGLHNMPLSLYTLIFISIPSRDPQFISFAIAFINVFLVSLFYIYTRRIYGNTMAVFSSVFLAFSSWGILFSRKIWSPDLMLLLLIPTFYFLSQLIINKKPKKTLPLFFFLTLLPQMHFSGIYFFLVTIIIFFVLKVKVNFRKAFLGILIGLIPALPYIFYNLTSIPFCPECQALFQYQGASRSFDIHNFIRPFQLLNGSYFDNPLGKDYQTFLNYFPFIKIFNIIFLIEFIIPIIGAILIYRYKKEYLFIIFYVVFIPFFYFLTKTPSYMYYYIIIFPAIILLFVSAFKISFDLSKKKIIKTSIICIFALLLTINFIFELSFYKFLSAKKVINGDYGPIISETKGYVNREINSYLLLPYYKELKIYAYFYAYPQILHQKLGYFFMQKNNVDLAILEFNKSLSTNREDLFSRANLAYIFIATGKINEAKEQISILENKDATTAAKLKEIMQQATKNSNK